jgi:hypothetical protein
MPHVLVLFGSLCSSAKYAYRSIASFIKAVTTAEEDMADATPVSDTGAQLPLEEHAADSKELDKALDAAKADNPSHFAPAANNVNGVPPEMGGGQRIKPDRRSTRKRGSLLYTLKKGRNRSASSASKGKGVAARAYQSTQPSNVCLQWLSSSGAR